MNSLLLSKHFFFFFGFHIVCKSEIDHSFTDFAWNVLVLFALLHFATWNKKALCFWRWTFDLAVYSIQLTSTKQLNRKSLSSIVETMCLIWCNRDSLFSSQNSQIGWSHNLILNTEKNGNRNWMNVRIIPSISLESINANATMFLECHNMAKTTSHSQWTMNIKLVYAFHPIQMLFADWYQ